MATDSKVSAPTPCAPKFWALIPCAGSGSRALTQGPKQYTMLVGKPLVVHTLEAFAKVDSIQHALLVVSPQDDFFTRQPQWLIQKAEPSWSLAACGGATRAQSVRNGLHALAALGAQSHDWVLVHDAARCLITPELIERLMLACVTDPVGGLLALPLPDTLKQATLDRYADNGDGKVHVDKTMNRDGKWLAQTPQMFRLGDLLGALDSHHLTVTDEASAMELAGHNPKLVASSMQNFKVTYPEDFALAESVLLARLKSKADAAPSFRLGEGWDVHQLVEGRPLILGGVPIPHTKGLLGHSDADVLLHAITDALLGAAGLGDIGRHFPDTDASFKGADSAQLLTQAYALVQQQGWHIGNIDATVVAQAPKLAPHMNAMRQRIAQILSIEARQVNVKAKTAEKLGPVGEGLSMEARAVVLIYC
ncbi:MAG: 2-C-methyl-D-erythritol 4-phosphate cytidylyltransferase [Betaproteobacteria bacterium]|nr:2-C-methyl-D-erythritol 4-phosphate cytidylyltransferase [Betaproteobacteria bacterium]